MYLGVFAYVTREFGYPVSCLCGDSNYEPVRRFASGNGETHLRRNMCSPLSDVSRPVLQIVRMQRKRCRVHDLYVWAL